MVQDTENKELIWVKKDFAERFKKIGNLEEQTRELDKYLSGIRGEFKEEFKATLEVMEEDIAIYKGLFLNVKQSFEASKNESIKAFYTMWEKYDKEKSDLEKKILNVKHILEPLQKTVDKVNESLGKISTYNFDKLIETISTFSRLCNDEKEMFDFLIKNFSAKEK